MDAAYCWPTFVSFRNLVVTDPFTWHTFLRYQMFLVIQNLTSSTSDHGRKLPLLHATKAHSLVGKYILSMIH